MQPPTEASQVVILSVNFIRNKSSQAQCNCKSMWKKERFKREGRIVCPKAI